MKKILAASQKKAALKLFKTAFVRKILKDKFLLKVNEISENIVRHRLQNFLGQILQHHSLPKCKIFGKMD